MVRQIRIIPEREYKVGMRNRLIALSGLAIYILAFYLMFDLIAAMWGTIGLASLLLPAIPYFIVVVLAIYYCNKKGIGV